MSSKLRHFSSQGRLRSSVASQRPKPEANFMNREQKLMPIIEEHEEAFFERPFRAQATNAPHGCGLERHFSSLWGGSSCTRRAFCGSGVARAAPSSILRFRGRLERHPSSILWLWGRRDRHFSSKLRLRGGLEQPFRANCGHMQQIAAFLEARQRTPKAL